jgi:hypothetical protein
MGAVVNNITLKMKWISDKVLVRYDETGLLLGVSESS